MAVDFLGLGETKETDVNCDFSELEGKVIIEVTDMEQGSSEVVFRCSDGSRYRMYHDQDCCENVSVEDVCGDVDDIMNTMIISAQEVVNPEDAEDRPDEDSYTWTFYNISTLKGYLTLRWYGSSNGYYSESVSFKRLSADTETVVK
jgi:hypothetical protein